MISVGLLKNRIYLYIGMLFFFLGHSLGVLYEADIYFSLLLLALILLFMIPMKKKTLMGSLLRYSLFLLFVILCLLLVQPTMGLGAVVVLMFFLMQYVYWSGLEITASDYKKIVLFFSLFAFAFLFLTGPFNPNTVGFVFLVCGIYATLFTRRGLKGIMWLLMVSLFVLPNIYLSESRTALVAYLFYIALRLTPTRFYKNSFFFNLIIVLLTIGSLAFVAFYVYAYQNDVLDVAVIEEASGSEKQVYTGRQDIWAEVAMLWSESPWTGIGSDIELQSFEDSVNLHNSMLNLFAIYGLITGTLVLVFLFRVLNPLRLAVDNYIVKNCLAAYFTFLLVGFTETNLLRELFVCSLVLGVAYSEKNRMLKNKIEHETAGVNVVYVSDRCDDYK